MNTEKIVNEKRQPALKVAEVINRPFRQINIDKCYPRIDYDYRRLPTFYFTKDFSIKDQSLFLKGEEYPTYLYNYSRMVDYLSDGTISMDGL